MKMPKGQGWYTYKDGYCHWVNGMSSTEKKKLIREHGEIVKYVPGK